MTRKEMAKWLRDRAADCRDMIDEENEWPLDYMSNDDWREHAGRYEAAASMLERDQAEEG